MIKVPTDNMTMLSPKYRNRCCHQSHHKKPSHNSHEPYPPTLPRPPSQKTPRRHPSGAINPTAPQTQTRTRRAHNASQNTSQTIKTILRVGITSKFFRRTKIRLCIRSNAPFLHQTQNHRNAKSSGKGDTLGPVGLRSGRKSSVMSMRCCD